MDAGFWSAMRIQNKKLRDFCSILFTCYYLLAAEQADEKVRKVRSVMTVDHMRVSWNKPNTPYLRAIGNLGRPKFTAYKPRRIRIPRPKNSVYKEPVSGWMYFDGTLADLEKQTNIVLDIPGGGFVAMDPRVNDDKLLAWAGKLGLPILSLDYRKAPEYPYPYALNECFDVYVQIAASRGRCIGMKPNSCPRIVVTGDSAGGNLATATILMIIQHNMSNNRNMTLPSPAGLMLMYPALDMNIGSWMTDDQMALIRNPKTAKRQENYIKRKSEDIDRRYTPATPRPQDEADHEHDFFAPRNPEQKTDVKSQQTTVVESKPQQLRTRLAVSSIISYFGDRILTPEMMRAMIILYVGPFNRPDFTTDYLLCPAVAPEALLAKFPKTYFMTGERDPLVDDTVIFAGKLRLAKLHLFRERQEVGLEKARAEFHEKDHVEVTLIPGISHGFLQIVAIYPEGWKHIFRCANWIKDMFEKPPHSFEGPSIESRNNGSLVDDSGSGLDMPRHHRRLPTGESEADDEPLVMSSLRDTANGTKVSKIRTQSDATDALGRTKSLVSLGSEEDLLKRRMNGLTISLLGPGE